MSSRRDDDVEVSFDDNLYRSRRSNRHQESYSYNAEEHSTDEKVLGMDVNTAELVKKLAIIAIGFVIVMAVVSAILSLAPILIPLLIIGAVVHFSLRKRDRRRR